MRELIEQDAREKQESLRAEVDAMRFVFFPVIFVSFQ